MQGGGALSCDSPISSVSPPSRVYEASIEAPMEMRSCDGIIAAAANCIKGAGKPLHVCFLEDTKLEGGTQIWVAEAARWFLGQGWKVTIVTPAGGFNAEDAAKIDGVRLVTYVFSLPGVRFAAAPAEELGLEWRSKELS